MKMLNKMRKRALKWKTRMPTRYHQQVPIPRWRVNFESLFSHGDLEIGEKTALVALAL